MCTSVIPFFAMSSDIDIRFILLTSVTGASCNVARYGAILPIGRLNQVAQFRLWLFTSLWQPITACGFVGSSMWVLNSTPVSIRVHVGFWGSPLWR